MYTVHVYNKKLLTLLVKKYICYECIIFRNLQLIVLNVLFLLLHGFNVLHTRRSIEMYGLDIYLCTVY